MKNPERREFWKKALGTMGAVVAYVMISRYLPKEEPFKEIKLRVTAKPEVDRRE